MWQSVLVRDAGLAYFCDLAIPTPSQRRSVLELKREIWLQRLPDEIQAALPHKQCMAMSGLLNHADALFSARRATFRLLVEIQDESVDAVISSAGRK